MNQYDCSKKICQLVEINAQNLRANDDQILFDNDSYRAAIARASHSLAKKWNKIISYNIGDLVALDGIVYISVTNGNISNNPKTDRLNWSYFVNPYAKNEGKIKAFCLHQGSTILKSYNIATLSKIETTVVAGIFKEFKFIFSTPFSTPPAFATSYPEVPNIVYETFENRGMTAFGTENTTTYTTITYTTQVNFDNSTTQNQNLAQYSDVTDLVGFIIWYENSDTVPL